ncbi:hypothetical protein [Kitasatospora terrestris]|uniref:MFS transporter n=1 Tax=Kitasatospora terrestris TaxID=258051 RepID=A0ABP9ELZ3_9ACTN
MGEPMHTAGAVRAVQSVLDRLGKDGQAEVRNWSVVWIGVDLLQAAGPVATGLAMTFLVELPASLAPAALARRGLDW